jgi:hypothetical protein
MPPMLRLSLLALACAVVPAAPQLLTLEIRVFRGMEEVTAETRITVHRAGERGDPVARAPIGEARAVMRVPPGIYDAQAIQERDGRVVNIRWAERLVVMPYPDEEGRQDSRL